MARVSDHTRALFLAQCPNTQAQTASKQVSPGICDECFKEQKPSERYYCPHNKQLAVLSEGCWETFRDVQPEDLCA